MSDITVLCDVRKRWEGRWSKARVVYRRMRDTNKMPRALAKSLTVSVLPVPAGPAGAPPRYMERAWGKGERRLEKGEGEGGEKVREGRGG